MQNYLTHNLIKFINLTKNQNDTQVTLDLSSNMVGDFNDETNYQDMLLLTSVFIGANSFVPPIAQIMKFSMKDLFSKCDQKLRIWSDLLKKSLMENFIFCAVLVKCRKSPISEHPSTVNMLKGLKH